MTHELIDVAAAVIRRDGRYLICRRRPGDKSGGLWEFPGGKREVGETLEQCAVREIREELGCEIEPGGLLHVVDTHWGGPVYRIHFFAAVLAGGEPRPIECSELAWVEPAGLGGYEFLPANREMLKMLASGGSPGVS